MRRPDGADDWIEREVRDFFEGPNGRNVIAVRGAGEFELPLPADLRQRFPNIEIIDLRGASRIWFLNPTRAARLASEKLKLVAPLLGIPPEEMPRLRQEEEKRQALTWRYNRCDCRRVGCRKQSQRFCPPKPQSGHTRC